MVCTAKQEASSVLSQAEESNTHSMELILVCTIDHLQVQDMLVTPHYRTRDTAITETNCPLGKVSAKSRSGVKANTYDTPSPIKQFQHVTITADPTVEHPAINTSHEHIVRQIWVHNLDRRGVNAPYHYICFLNKCQFSASHGPTPQVQVKSKTL